MRIALNSSLGSSSQHRLQLPFCCADLQITLIGFNIKVFIGLVLLTQLVAERLLNEAIKVVLSMFFSSLKAGSFR